MKGPLKTLAAAWIALTVVSLELNAMNVQIREGRPIVDGVYIDGHGPYRFMIDTGATLNHVDTRLAKSLGLKETFRTMLTSSTGRIDVPGGKGIHITLGSARAENQTFLFAGLDVVQQTWFDVQGILGQAFLSQFDYLLDMHRKQLEFGPHEVGAQSIRTEFKLDNGRPVVSTSLGWLVLDSGSPRLTRFGIKGTIGSLAMRTMSSTMALGTIDSTLSIDGRVFWRGEAMAVPQTPEAGVDGLLPTSVFKTVYVCNSGRFVAFEF